MGKAVVFSILLATIAIPLFFARKRNGQRGLARAVFFFYVYCALWAFATLYIAPHL